MACLRARLRWVEGLPCLRARLRCRCFNLPKACQMMRCRECCSCSQACCSSQRSVSRLRQPCTRTVQRLRSQLFSTKSQMLLLHHRPPCHPFMSLWPRRRRPRCPHFTPVLQRRRNKRKLKGSRKLQREKRSENKKLQRRQQIKSVSVMQKGKRRNDCGCKRLQRKRRPVCSFLQ